MALVPGQITQGPSFTMTTPRAKAQAPTQSDQLTSPYTGSFKGVEPGTISAQPFLDYAEQVQTLALDPRGEIREREQQRLQEQTRAGLSSRGLNLSGAGAGIEAQAMSDFGLDWQNQQLARAGQGAQQLQLLGGLGQNIAQAGFQNAIQLGASQFEYEPDVSGYGGGGGGVQYSYTPAPSYGGGGGYGGGPSPWLQEQQRRQQETQRLSEMSNLQYGGSWYGG